MHDFLKGKIFLFLTGHHLAYRNSSPCAYYTCNIFFRNFLFKQGFPFYGTLLAVHVFPGLCHFSSNLLFKFRNDGILELGRFLQIPFASVFLKVKPGLLKIFLHLAAAFNDVLLILPLQFHGITLVLHFSKFLLKFFKALYAGFVILLFQRLTFNLKLHYAAFKFVQFNRLAFNFHLKAASGFINKVNSLVRQKTARDVPVA